MPSLSLPEAQQRAAHVTVSGYDVSLDLTGDADTFGSRTVVRFAVAGPADTFVDLSPARLHDVRLNGLPLDPGSARDGRLALAGVDGANELVVEASMRYRRDGEGLHRATDPADGKVYTYAMSFLDAAPSIFACFDQPDLKAPYTFHVRTPTDWVVVGNGRAIEVEPGRWELATTPPLSTYFVTLVAGPYHQVLDEHDGITLGLECRASLAPHLDREAAEILTVTRQCFDEFHRLFDRRYPFGDYHQAFVPEFNAGAMENPGCVTFRDPLVFTSPVTRAERTGRATTIAHEMAHQWFGDLVTPRWWDDLWLNESFAEYMGNRVAHDATEFSDAHVETAFGRKRWGLEADQRPSTHPVAGNGAADARSALQNFDGISYVKGSALLRQLQRTVGDEVFLAGVRTHFARHAYGNASMQDLLDAWEEAGAGDLAGWRDSWLRTAGVDLLSLDRSTTPPQVVRTVPLEHPADRLHTLTAAVYDGQGGWAYEPVTVSGAPALLGEHAVGRPVVLDPGDDSWARLGLDDLTLERLPELLPAATDPLLRAAVWSAVRDGVSSATVDPETALRLVATALPHEDRDVAVASLSTFATTVLIDRLVAEPAESSLHMRQSASRLLATTAPGSGLQLAAFRALVSVCSEPALLSGWLEDGGLPQGLSQSVDLRWRLLGRLAVTGAVGRTDLQAHLDAEPTSEAVVHHARALAALPEPDAKEQAWSYFTGRAEGSNYEVEASGRGFWQRGQEDLVAPYVDRYFAEVPATSDVRTGWVLAAAATAFFPRLAVSRSTLGLARSTAADHGLEPGLARALADATDDLGRMVASRERFLGA